MGKCYCKAHRTPSGGKKSLFFGQKCNKWHVQVLLPTRDPLAPIGFVLTMKRTTRFYALFSASIILSDYSRRGFQMSRSRFFSRFGLFIGLFVVCTTQLASAQWRIKTPRDTVNVPASKEQNTLSKLKLNSGVEALLRVSGTFTFNVGG